MSIDPIVKTVRVGLTPQAAFDLFTTRMGEWWPIESHSVSAGQGAPSKSLGMTARLGGEIAEVASDGTTHIWGKIDDWNPGKMFACTWHPGRTDGSETRLRVTFEADGDGTLVTLTHSDWEALGEEGAKTREGYDGGWTGVLERFTQSAQSAGNHCQ